MAFSFKVAERATEIVVVGEKGDSRLKCSQHCPFLKRKDIEAPSPNIGRDETEWTCTLKGGSQKFERGDQYRTHLCIQLERDAIREGRLQ